MLLVVLQLISKGVAFSTNLSTAQTFGNRIVRLVTLDHPFPSREYPRISSIRQ